MGSLVKRLAHRRIAVLADAAGVVGLAGLADFFGVKPKCGPTCFEEVEFVEGSSIAQAKVSETIGPTAGVDIKSLAFS